MLRRIFMTDSLKKVKLKDIKPNPYRNFEIYPIRDDKVLQLVESIQTTTFWGGLVGREKDGKIEIAYGHHRLEALRKMFEPDAEFSVSVEPLSDEDMMKMMSRENAEEWTCPIAAIDDAVKAVRDHLNSDRDAARKCLSLPTNEDKRVRIGAPVIAKFMGKKEGTVRKSLERLNLIERGEVDREALYLMPSSAAAERFARAVRDYGIKNEHQKIVAEKIVADRRFGERSIYETVTEFFPREQLRKITEYEASYLDFQLRKAIRDITRLRKTLATLWAPRPVSFLELSVATTEDITPETYESYNRAVVALTDSIRKAAETLDKTKLAAA
jgi:ParB-like chromosome segregation protein Spo0J